MSDILLVKVKVPEWVPQSVRKEIVKEIEDNMIEAIMEVWGNYAPTVVSSKECNEP
jgi:hypothetical protein